MENRQMAVSNSPIAVPHNQKGLMPNFVHSMFTVADFSPFICRRQWLVSQYTPKRPSLTIRGYLVPGLVHFAGYTIRSVRLPFGRSSPTTEIFLTILSLWPSPLSRSKTGAHRTFITLVRGVSRVPTSGPLTFRLSFPRFVRVSERRPEWDLATDAYA